MRTFLTDSRRRLRRRAVALRRAPACPRSAAGRGAPALRNRMAEAGPSSRKEPASMDFARQTPNRSRFRDASISEAVTKRSVT